MVYVDDMYLTPMGQFGRMKMSHMMADSTIELLDMADKIGVQKKWIQEKGNKLEHFDISMGMRKKAIELGVIPVDMYTLARAALDRTDQNSVIIK